ncbi:hypothetical protein Q9L58_002082 [Maublancomyces gigas]|uniref:Uncharacterized protein n=1 Tax=Discina gigas TaxID=1032678 RepID=A0ABR3GSE1_9PEZI
MRFGPTLLLSATAAAAAANCGDDDTRSIHSHTTDALVQQQYNPVAETASSFAAQEQQQPLDIQFPPTQARNQTSGDEHVQKRTDSSTPGTQIMSPWRQVVGGIAVAVLVAVI